MHSGPNPLAINTHWGPCRVASGDRRLRRLGYRRRNRLALKVAQFLLLTQQFDAFAVAAFGLVGPLHQLGQLAVYPLVAQPLRHIGNLP